jgi:small redox-active disulfide protein 2
MRMMKRLQVFGSGCAKCKKLAEVTEDAAKALAIEFSLEKVSDLVQIMNHGIMMTPALAVDGEVKVAGRVPSTDEIKKMLA